MKEFNTIIKSIVIHASVSEVWRYLTSPDLMKTWMLDDQMELEIVSNWKVNGPLIMKGKMHDIQFENKGKIIKYLKEENFSYSLLSSLSNLPDREDSYSIMDFELHSVEGKTNLKLTISNFPEESIYRHLNFYWTVALEGLKQQMEVDKRRI